MGQHGRRPDREGRLRIPSKRGAAALLLAAAAIGGCGSSGPLIKVGPRTGPIPRSKQPIDELVGRLNTVQSDIQAGRCASANEFNRHSGFRFVCDRRGKRAYKGFKVLGTQVFGTGAIIEFTDTQIAKTRRQPAAPGVTTRGDKNVGILPAALRASGRFELTGPAAQILPGSVIGTKPTAWKKSDLGAVVFLNSIRYDKCSAFFENSITPPGFTQKQACKAGLQGAYAELHKQLADGKVSLFRLGANSVFYFYGVRTHGQFRTLLVGKARPPAPPFLAFGTTKAT